MTPLVMRKAVWLGASRPAAVTYVIFFPSYPCGTHWKLWTGRDWLYFWCAEMAHGICPLASWNSHHPITVKCARGRKATQREKNGNTHTHTCQLKLWHQPPSVNCLTSSLTLWVSSQLFTMQGLSYGELRCHPDLSNVIRRQQNDPEQSVYSIIGS